MKNVLIYCLSLFILLTIAIPSKLIAQKRSCSKVHYNSESLSRNAPPMNTKKLKIGDHFEASKFIQIFNTYTYTAKNIAFGNNTYLFNDSGIAVGIVDDCNIESISNKGALKILDKKLINDLKGYKTLKVGKNYYVRIGDYTFLPPLDNRGKRISPKHGDMVMDLNGKRVAQITSKKGSKNAVIGVIFKK